MQHMTFRFEVVCLNFIFVGNEVCLHSMDCCFDLGSSCDTHVSFLVTTWLKEFSPSSLYCVRKSNVVACCCNLCSSISNFGTQFAYNFWNLTLPDTIWWRRDHEIWEKMQEMCCNGESSVVSNLLLKCTHQIFIHHRQSAAPQIIIHNFVSFIKQSHPSPYHWTTHSMYPIQVTKLTNFSQFHVLHIQEMDYRSHFTCGGILYFLKHYKHNMMCWYRSNVCKLCLCLATESTNSAHTHTIMSTVLQWQY